MKKYLDLLRVHHWLKNFYIFIPLFFNKDLSIINLIYLSEIFIIFSLSASTIYIFNDLIDYESDRKNPWKKNRPIASDLFSKKDSIFVISVLLILLIFLLYFFYISKFVIYLIFAYFLINILYSLLLKKIFILNYLILVSFFYIRLIAGTIENQIPLSNWLTVFILTSSLILIIGKKLSDFDYSDKLNNKKKKILVTFITLIAIAQLIIYIIFVNTDYALMKYGNLFQYSSLFVILGTIRYLLLIKKGSVTSDQINLFLKDKILIFSSLTYLIYLFLIFY
tara:strand:- start:5770 stop:6609 length:840 start_codon:yes stop_codon:yes gene_type:complete